MSFGDKMTVQTDNFTAALINDAAHDLIDDRPVLHRTADGVDLTPDDRGREIFFAQSNPERIFAESAKCAEWYAEEGNNLNGDDDLVDSQVFGAWLGDPDFQEVA